ncbi:MAG: ribosomal protein S18-alanine N-acetyltransferase [bacterium]
MLTKKLTCADLHIRPMAKDDLNEILSVEREAFPDPWTNTMFDSEIEQRSSNLFVAEKKTNGLKYIITGYAVYRIIDSYAEIMNLCVKAEFRRMRIGASLLEYMLSAIATERIAQIYLEVRTTNLPAVNLYSRYGFILNRIRKNYYTDGSDACEMIRTVSI